MTDESGMPYEIAVEWGEAHLNSLLRNGYAKQHGIGIQKLGDRGKPSRQLWILAVNSKGGFSTGRICIPMSHVNEFIEALQKIKEDQP